MWRSNSYLSGALLLAMASVLASSASCARFEEAGDLKVFKRNAVIHGGLFALALVLFCAPRLIGRPRWRYVLVLSCAALVWVAVSVQLRSSHEERFHKRVLRHEKLLGDTK